MNLSEHEMTVAVEAAAKTMFEAQIAGLPPEAGVSWDTLDLNTKRRIKQELLPIVVAALEAAPDRDRADAWDEGATKASPHGGGYLRSILIENPYRKPS